MANGLRPNRAHGERLRDRLERAAHDVNAVLLVLAIGLAALDTTCFFVLEMADAMATTRRTATHQIASRRHPVAQAAIPPAAAADGRSAATAAAVRSGSR